MGVKAEILWCPTADDIFLAWGSDIQVYQTREASSNPDTSLSQGGAFKISDSTVASLLCTSTDYSYIKCVAWSNAVSASGAKLLAVGQANGKVRVTSLGCLIGDSGPQHNREYVPRHGRCVNSLSWSEGSDSNLLLAALDRSGRDPSLLLYDVSRLPSATQQTQSSSSSRHHSQSQQSGGWQRPAGEFCCNEVVHSAVFSRHTRSAIIAATAHKYLKILDIRNGNNTHNINTKAVYGLCCDPHSSYRVASYYENSAHIWDLRHTSLPAVTLSMPKPIIKIQWCPTRYGFLGCLSRECSSVQLFDLQFAGCDLQEASVAMRVAADTSPAYTSTFSWHHKRYNVLLTAASTGTLMEHRVRERVTLNWSSRGDLIYTGDGSDLSPPHSSSSSVTNSNMAVSSSASSRVAAASTVTNSQFRDTVGQLSSDLQTLSVSSSTVTSTVRLSFSESVTSTGSGSAPSQATRTIPPNSGRLYRLSAEEYHHAPCDSVDASSPPVSPIADILQDDISRIMAKRAVAGYGLQCKENLSANGDIASAVGWLTPECMESLRSVWRWLERAYLLTKASSFKLKTGQPYLYHGLLSILSQPNVRSDSFNKPWSGLENNKHTTRIFSFQILRGSLVNGNDPVTSTCLHGNDPVTSTSLHGNDPVTSTCLHGNDPVTSTCLHGNDPVTSICLHGNDPVTSICLHGNDPVTSICLHGNDLITSRSEERSVCLQLVSWLPLQQAGGTAGSTASPAPALHLNNLEEAIEHATAAKQYCRAAALAVFQLQLPRAISLLQAAAARSSDPTLNAVAMALSGYTGERKMLWRDTCASLRQSLSDPHLRAVFAFLTEDTDSYSPLLLSSDLSVCDRIGFALTFLSDTRLVEYLNQLLIQLTAAPCPDLQGLVLTGMDNEEGVSLVQSYVDSTSDVQTAALLGAHGFRHTLVPLPTDSPLTYWVESYQQLLTSQQLFRERAALVVLVPQATPPPHHAVLACDYCCKSITSSHSGLPHSPNKPQLARMLHAAQQQHTKNKERDTTSMLQQELSSESSLVVVHTCRASSSSEAGMISCPHCRKPLPRCALCLQHLGTPSHSPDIHNKHHGHKVEKNMVDDAPNAPHHLFIPSNTQALLCENQPGLNPFPNWFTWCQTCKHGGHANHVMNWFSEHDECPVTGCTCPCLLQDKIGRPSFRNKGDEHNFADNAHLPVMSEAS
ncbi:WD repeat protein mio zinc-ribbon like domain [Trinorchestia longiramus]|nr:WD repeat protein mio zinc-ribbon like domain [Trinorchestia longiramus]